LSLDGQSTEAGIRQLLGPDSLPVILDEFESDNDRRRMERVIKLARSASSAESTVARGTPEGKALQFTIRTTFLFGAINPVIVTAADASRIVQLELMSHDNDREVAKKIELKMRAMQLIGPAWCRMAVDLVEMIPSAIELFRAAMPPGDNRHGRNMATLLAGAWLALEQKLPSTKEAGAWVDRFASSIEIHAEPHETDDALECLNQLMGIIIREDYQISSIGECLSSIKNAVPNDQYQQKATLIRHGIRWTDEGPVVANNHPELNKMYKDTRWANGAWRTALRRLTGAHPVNSAHFGGVNSRGTLVPKEFVPDRPDEPDGRFAMKF
jgi:hypothetical protein